MIKIHQRTVAIATAIACLLALPLQLTAREFTNNKGNKIEAEIVKVTGDKVVIERDDAKKFTIPIKTLSKEDQKFIAEWREKNAKSTIRFHFSKKRLSRVRTAGGTQETWAFDIDVHNEGLEDVSGLEVNYSLYKTLRDHYTKKKNIVTMVETGNASIKQIKRGNKSVLLTKAIPVIRDGSTSTSRTWDGITYYYQRWDESLTGCKITITRNGKVIAKRDFGTTVEYGGIEPKGAGNR